MCDILGRQSYLHSQSGGFKNNENCACYIYFPARKVILKVYSFPYLRDRIYFVSGQVVTAWINTCPETATWTNLVEALTEVGRRKTAQEVAEKRGNKSIMVMMHGEPCVFYACSK